MFANALFRTTYRQFARPASIAHQRVRFLKSFRLAEGAHGCEPLITTDDYENAKDNDQLEDLSFKPIRFALIWENNSPLFDRDYERFCRYVMKGGRKELSHDLVHRTFYQIKTIQYNRLRKLREKRNKAEADSKATSKSEDDDAGQAPGSDLQESDENEIETNPLTILKIALKNCEPYVITKKVKRGGATYQVPYPLDRKLSEYYAYKWIIRAVLDRPKPRTKLFPEVMAQEILDAYNNQGKVVKKRDDMHRLADANKAYSHYRWG